MIPFLVVVLFLINDVQGCGEATPKPSSLLKYYFLVILCSYHILVFDACFSFMRYCFFCLNSLRTTLCVRFKSEMVACGVVYAAAQRFQVALPENEPWWEVFDADKSAIDEVCRVLAHLYSLPKAQYIPVCKDGDSFTASNKSRDSQTQPVSKVILIFPLFFICLTHMLFC